MEISQQTVKTKILKSIIDIHSEALFESLKQFENIESFYGKDLSIESLKELKKEMIDLINTLYPQQGWKLEVVN